jgi:hypothetical protein
MTGGNIAQGVVAEQAGALETFLRGLAALRAGGIPARSRFGGFRHRCSGCGFPAGLRD